MPTDTATTSISSPASVRRNSSICIPSFRLISGFIIAQFPAGDKGKFFGTPSPLHLDNHTAAGYALTIQPHLIYDIAREAGVSIATVSRVLNHKDTVRADTRAKVEKVLKRCNYAPSAIAQGMVSKSLHTVAVLTVDIRDSHYARTAYTIEREFGRRGYEVILCNTGGDRAETLRTLQAVAQKQVDGLILVGSIFNTICQGAEMENLLRKMPVVLANGTLALPDAYSVMVDDCRGVEMAVEHLVKTGRRNLYYIKDKSTDSAAAKAKGFLSGMAAAGLDADGHILETGETLEDGIRAVQQLLAEGIRPDGILCGEDLTAAGVLKALLRAGIRVPEETAVVGYDNSTYARLCEPELTSVDNKPEQVALLCVQLLQSRIEHGEDYSSVTLQPELVQRQSS